MSTDTEFACEVVKVTGIEPHPGADRLEIASFEMKSGPSAYRVVVGKGSMAPGDKAVYLSVDCIVPRGLPAFDFLFQRLDGQGKDKFRVKAARIRGMYSEGILLPITDFGMNIAPMGMDMAEKLGITYYVAPTKGSSTPAGAPSQAKDAGWGGRFPVYTVESLRKVPFLFEEGETVVITEKIHGTNFRAGWVKGRFLVGSHRTIKTDLRPWYARLWDWMLRRPSRTVGYYGEDLWMDTVEKFALKTKLKGFAPGIVIYGEVYGKTSSGKAIQDMLYGGPTLGLRLFDAYDTKRGLWLGWGELEKLATILGVEVVPTILIGRYSLDIVKQLAEGCTLVPGTDYKTDIREGVVVRTGDPEEKRKRGKWVSEAYRLRKEVANA